jgi:phosphatidate phosphatase APP1
LRPRVEAQPLRWRILARIRRFFWPSLRRPFPDFLTPIPCLPVILARRPRANGLSKDLLGCKMGGTSLQADPPANRCMIRFFPTYARRTDSGWRATVAGMVARPLPQQSRRRALAVAVFRRMLDLDEVDLASEVFRRRADCFLFQRVPGQPVRIRLADRLIEAGISDRSGHFNASFELSDDEVAVHAHAGDPGSRWLPYDAEAGEEELVAAADCGAGRIHLIEGQGFSVISDIDDTVKVSNVADRRELLRNTLLREFRAVPGMAAAYRRWEAAGAAFHYVSASPWQLSTCLCDFLGSASLPAGSMHLKLFRLKDSTPLGRLTARKRSKRRAIEQIMADFPDRRFLLVGDSGERDPEVYAAVARRRPDQVAGVLIRRVPDRKAASHLSLRFDKLARRLPTGTLQTFTAADELPQLP